MSAAVLPSTQIGDVLTSLSTAHISPGDLQAGGTRIEDGHPAIMHALTEQRAFVQAVWDVFPRRGITSLAQLLSAVHEAVL